MLAWLILGVWLLVLAPIFVGATADDRSLIEFLSYRRAGEALARGDSPYASAEQAHAMWLAFHQLDVDLRAASERRTADQVLQAVQAQPLRAGPYLYPPTLALVVGAWHVSDRAFTLALGVAIVGFTWLWLRSTGASSWWLLLVIGSWDVLASWTGGNVEHLLLVATLVAARLLWTQRGWLAAVPMAFVLVIKPFYVLFFVAFGLLQLRAVSAAGARCCAPRCSSICGPPSSSCGWSCLWATRRR